MKYKNASKIVKNVPPSEPTKVSFTDLLIATSKEIRETKFMLKKLQK